MTKFNWSFSGVNSFNNCPRCFYWTYIDRKPQVQNAFAEWGSFGHSLLEQYFKGEKEFYELSQAYVNGYDENVKLPFPPNAYVDLSERYFEAGKNYFDNYDGLPDQYKVLEVETKIKLTIDGYSFVGFADLIIEDKEDGGIIVVDHKSKSKFSNKTEQDEYARQLYLYSLYVKEEYGEYPKELRFNMFRASEEVIIPFSEKELEKAVWWFTRSIGQICSYETEKDFKDKIAIEYAAKNKDVKAFKHDDFFCNELCGVREHCERSKCFKGGG